MDNDVLKTAVYNNLVINAHETGIKTPTTTGLVTKALYNIGKQGIEKKIEDVDKKIPNTSGLFKKTDYNKKNYRDWK